MGRYYLDEDEKRIARAIVRLDNKRTRKNRKQATAFDKKAAAAVEKANADINIDDELLAKVKQNIISGIAWEYIGETYCSRNTFYGYARRYLFYVARAFGIVEDKKKGGGG